jgi:hypothetical protein
MIELVVELKIKKDPRYFYFITAKGDVARVRRVRKKKGYVFRPEIIKRVGIKREKGYIYFICKKGNIARTKIKRRRMLITKWTKSQ